MSDFKELVHDRRVTARSAKNHVNARRGRCRLPHENLTRKEWEKLNGEITTVNTKRPMKWEEFKALPKGLQETYFNAVIDTYNCGLRGMATMFGISEGGLSQYIRAHKLNTTPQRKGRKLTKETRELWEEFMQRNETPKKDGLPKSLFRWSITFRAGSWDDVLRVVSGMPIDNGSVVTVAVE